MKLYGPAGTAPGSSLTAIAAINKIRTKSGMPNVRAEFIGSKDAFRPRIKNERNVELGFEVTMITMISGAGWNFLR